MQTHELVHPSAIDPRTGLALRAIGVLPSGRIVWPVMGGDPSNDDPKPEDKPDDKPDPKPEDKPDDKPDPKPEDKPDDKSNDVKSLPEWAQKLISDTRAEAANHRTAKNEAETKHQASLDAIARALGLKPDDEKDPDKLTQQLTESQADTKSSRIELAVFKAAGKLGADAEALLDSRKFLDKVGKLDPKSGDFAESLTSAIEKAVEADPKLKAEATVVGDGDGGTRTPHGGGGEPSIEDFVNKANKKKS